MKRVRRLAAASVVAIAVAGEPSSTSAQLIVFDPKNYAQNVLTAARELQQEPKAEPDHRGNRHDAEEQRNPGVDRRARVQDEIRAEHGGDRARGAEHRDP